LPLLLVVEHNKIAQSTPWMLEHSTPIEGRPIAFGVDTVSVDGNDALLVHKTTQQLVDEMRETPSPRCLVLHTNRLGPHSKGDDTRDLHEIEGLRAFDPIRQLSAKIPKSRISAIHQECEAELNDLLAEFSIF
jgi:pyruvate dehydrogenase E1 component alpha subunit